jgi:hypothetical protein
MKHKALLKPLAVWTEMLWAAMSKTGKGYRRPSGKAAGEPSVCTQHKAARAHLLRHRHVLTDYVTDKNLARMANKAKP